MSSKHLSDEELALAVVDEGDLSAASRQHLAACPPCRARKETLENDLTRLGLLAGRLVVPKASKVERVESVSRRPWAWPLGLKLGGAAAAALLLGLLLLRPGDTPDNLMVSQDLAASGNASQLLLEVEALTENPLSTFHKFVIGETAAGLDDEFLEFLIPISEEDTMTQKGGSTWSRKQYTV